MLAIAFAVGALLILSTSASTAGPHSKGLRAGWVWGPQTCVHVWMFRSRQTRYAGAPRCRRMPA
jgi:hypothetical protein